ncbi:MULTISPECIES: hypothetical protein [Nitrincola]|uniref:Lipoprotein n=1 Tax=Nitrincola nitratireducens TaxID=1229521 RepID=W9UXL8_9GAMM|nr:MULTISPECIES: hypothetical protein [Nitrincola]EXJ09466.1 hypothetical protein D791_03625 [Nitrincola nitratireducens]
MKAGSAFGTRRSPLLSPRFIRTAALLSTASLLSACGSLDFSMFARKSAPVEEVVEVIPPPPALPKPALIISRMVAEPPQSRGDAGAYIDFINGTDLTVEYVMFKTTAYDESGRIVPAKRSGDPNTWLRVAGPFAPGQASGSRHWEQLWQNRNLRCFEIEGVELIYMDGMVEFYESDRIALLPGSEDKNSCS